MSCFLFVPKRLRSVGLGSLALLLAGCASKPPVPDWQLNAHGASQRAVQAYFEGRQRVERAEFARARSEISRTGDAGQLARLELLRCAAQVASLDLTPCTPFDVLAQDATPAERAYARYLAGRAEPADLVLLPQAQRAAGSAAPEQAATVVAALADPLARLVAAGVQFARAQASPQLVALAVDTASQQGWRRPLLAWLGVQEQLAEARGDATEAARVRRRIAIASQDAQRD
ncbi:MAG: hypothetical protein M9919_02690 [Burkholderiaceae bacterium]|jgi:hypothetical protein|nr:hypothetical protein [Burkholderiaceae bacterium]MCO5102893.1 hypothetical protein [Burkholderiaceae bacterium]